MNAKTTKKLLSGFAMPGMLLHITFGSLLLFSASSALHPRNWRSQIAVSPALTQQDREAGDILSQDIRGARSVQSATATELVLNTSHGSVAYGYNAAARTLTRCEGENRQVVLASLDSLSFSLFQRPAGNEAFNTFSPATVENAKLVACRWSSSQRIAGAKLDSDSFEVGPTLLRDR
jgi:hypothetical protein